jgi:hypothetical protein
LIGAQISQPLREFSAWTHEISSMLDGVTERLRRRAPRTELV